MSKTYIFEWEDVENKEFTARPKYINELIDILIDEFVEFCEDEKKKEEGMMKLVIDGKKFFINGVAKLGKDYYSIVRVDEDKSVIEAIEKNIGSCLDINTYYKTFQEHCLKKDNVASTKMNTILIETKSLSVKEVEILRQEGIPIKDNLDVIKVVFEANRRSVYSILRSKHFFFCLYKSKA